MIALIGINPLLYTKVIYHYELFLTGKPIELNDKYCFFIIDNKNKNIKKLKIDKKIFLNKITDININDHVKVNFDYENYSQTIRKTEMKQIIKIKMKIARRKENKRAKKIRTRKDIRTRK